MKKLFFLLFTTLMVVINSQAQNAPRGMKYQAVARDLKGEVLADSKIELKINLLSSENGVVVTHYAEVHQAQTNKLGLFNLVIGEGKVEKGLFDEVPWSTADIWMEIQIKANGQNDFTSISNSQLLAVPYAYHAATAGVVVGNELQNTAEKKHEWKDRCPCEGGISQVEVLYLGPSNVTIRVYRKSNLTELLATFPNTADGAILTVSALNYPDGKLKNETYFHIENSGIPVTEVPTSCDEQFVGETFGNFSILSHRDRKNNSLCTVCDIRMDWKLGGNAVLDLCNKLGTKSYNDLIFITNNMERLRITKDGNINLNNNLEIGNSLTITNNVDIGNDLTVKRNVFLNTTGGSTINNGPFSVTNTSATNLTGILNVDKDAWMKMKLRVDGVSDLNGALNVNNMSPANLTGILNVNKDAWMKMKLRVDGITDLNSALNVNNTAATTLTGTLTTSGLTTINNQLNVTKDVADGQWLASFTNTNNGNGDGLKIKLGKAKSIYSPPAIPGLLSSGQQSDLRNLVSCQNLSQKAQLLVNLLGNAGLEDLQTLAGIAVGAGNMIINQVNSLLGLPITIPELRTPAIPIWDEIVLFGGLCVPVVGCVPRLAIPALTIPSVKVFDPFVVMPALPQISLSGIDIPDINLTDLSFWGVPDICLTDAPGSTPMNNANEFIRFSDKNDAKMGAIRAVSVSDWSSNYLNPVFLFTLYGALTSSKVDKFHARYHFQTEIGKALLDYSKLGVEYSSGNGDYAEWLERMEVKELVTAGDIIAVKGGKITKDLSQAEQVMVVSHNPIVLGNVPKEGKGYAGNNIAFMGQVPVKVMGPVATGDYIVGQINTPGYGIAKHPNDMTIEDFKFAVGRSWVNDAAEGPKMVNTVVGIHNGDYMKVLKNFESKFNDSESRLQALESKVDALINKPSTDKKKGF